MVSPRSFLALLAVGLLLGAAVGPVVAHPPGGSAQMHATDSARAPPVLTSGPFAPTGEVDARLEAPTPGPAGATVPMTTPDADDNDTDVPRPAEHAWRRTFSDRPRDQFEAVAGVAGGGVVAVGQRTSGAADRAWVVVTDANGSVTVNRTYAPNPTVRETAVDVAVLGESTGGSATTSDEAHGYALLGRDSQLFDQDNWLLRLDATGDIVWTRNFSAGEDRLRVTGVTATPAGLVVVGVVERRSEDETWVGLVDRDGDLDWQREFDAPAPVDVTTTNAGVVVGGRDSRSSALLALDTAGRLRWRYDATAAVPWLEAVAPAADGDGAVAASSGMSSVLVVDRSGDRRWNESIEIPPSADARPRPGTAGQPRLVDVFTSDHGVVLAGRLAVPGEVPGRPLVARVGPEGLETSVAFNASPADRVRGAARMPDGGVTFVGATRPFDGAIDRTGPIRDDGTPAPADWDGDGVAEDVTGDGAVDVWDVRALAERLGLEVAGLAGADPTVPPPGSATVDEATARALAPAYDVTGDGTVDVRDVRALYDSLPVRTTAVAVKQALVTQTGPAAGQLPDRYVTSITTRTGLDRLRAVDTTPGEPSPAATFLNQTDFDRSFLVVYQIAATSTPPYSVQTVRQLQGSLSLTVSNAALTGTLEPTPETLLVRVHLDGRSRPDTVSITASGADRSLSAPLGGQACETGLDPLRRGLAPPTDPDCDGVAEDANGDGRFTVLDVVAFLDAYDAIAPSDAPHYDVDGNGRLSILDVAALLAEL